MLKAGESIGAYEVERVLGQGALSTVYLARHRDLGVHRAVKVLGSLRPDLADRFLEEGRIQARLEHPNLVRVHDVLRLDGGLALVMDYAPGETLDRWTGSGRPWTEVEPVFRSICDAVAFAHAAGLVHRDLKPQNVIVTQGVPRVTDFGIAKRADGAGATSHGSLLGTPRYMAPEQMRDSSAVDARADVWALGCILHEMLMGKPPFDGSDLIALHGAMVAGRRPPTEGPERAVAAVRSALVADPSRRTPNVAGLIAILDGAVPDAPPISATWTDVLPSDRYEILDATEVRAGLSRLRVRDRVTGRAAITKRLVTAGNGALLERMRREERILREGGDGLAPLVDAFFVGTGEERAFWLIREPVGLPVTPGSLAPLEGVLELLVRLHAREPAVVVRDLAPSRWEQGPRGWVLVDLAGIREEPTAELEATFAGEFGFAAPETWRGEAVPATDVFGAGTLAIWLLTGTSPAIDKDGRVSWPRTSDASVNSWIDRLTRRDPATRPTASEALAGLLRILRPKDAPALLPHETPIVPPRVRYAEPETGPGPDFPEPPVLHVPAPPGISRNRLLVAGAVAMPLGLVLALIAVLRLMSPNTAVTTPVADSTPLLASAGSAWANSPDVRACLADFLNRNPDAVAPRIDVDVTAAPGAPVLIDALPGRFLADPLAACLNAAEATGPHPVLDVPGRRTLRWNLDVR